MAAPITITLPRTYTPAPAAPRVSGRSGRVLAWSALGVAFGPLLLPLGALHALSHVLEVRREAGPWHRPLIALAIGVALMLTGTGLLLRFDTTDTRSTAGIELRIADRTLASVRGELLLTDGWSLGGRATLGTRTF